MRSSFIIVTLALAACNTAPTRIDVTVFADPSVSVDALELRMNDNVIDTDPEPELELEVTDSTAGHANLIEVWGLAGGDEVAYGFANVVPVKHGVVITSVALGGADCSTGECTGNPPPNDSCSCDSPPATECVSATSANVYTGACDASNTCHYTATEQSCGAGCDAGDCRQWTAIAAAINDTCALRSDGSITCWGADTEGLSNAPAGDFISLSMQNETACAIDATKAVQCWGDNSSSQRDDIPTGSFTSVADGGVYVCGIRSDQTLACWGHPDGLATLHPPAGDFTEVAVGDDHACGIKTDKTIACWGDDTYSESDPPAISATTIAAGGTYSCAVEVSGALACWGSLEWVGPDGSGYIWSAPTGSYLSVVAQSIGGLALRSDGVIVSLGAGPTTSTTRTFRAMAIGQDYGCGITTSGALACFGDDAAGGNPP